MNDSEASKKPAPASRSNGEYRMLTRDEIEALRLNKQQLQILTASPKSP
jgi:hypothetical protein